MRENCFIHLVNWPKILCLFKKILSLKNLYLFLTSQLNPKAELFVGSVCLCSSFVVVWIFLFCFDGQKIYHYTQLNLGRNSVEFYCCNAGIKKSSLIDNLHQLIMPMSIAFVSKILQKKNMLPLRWRYRMRKKGIYKAGRRVNYVVRKINAPWLIERRCDVV